MGEIDDHEDPEERVEDLVGREDHCGQVEHGLDAAVDLVDLVAQRNYGWGFAICEKVEMAGRWSFDWKVAVVFAEYESADQSAYVFALLWDLREDQRIVAGVEAGGEHGHVFEEVVDIGQVEVAGID